MTMTSNIPNKELSDLGVVLLGQVLVRAAFLAKDDIFQPR